MSETEPSGKSNATAFQKVQRILKGCGVPERVVEGIIRKWGLKAPDLLLDNPYILTEHFRSVGFGIADRIGKRLKIKPDFPERIRAALRFVIQTKLYRDSHTWLPRLLVVGTATQLLKLKENLILEELEYLVKADEITIENNRVYANPLRWAEKKIAARAMALVSQALPVRVPDLQKLKSDQVQAVELATRSSIFIISGAPGTGKTYTIQRLLDTFGGVTDLTAPTGKAAKRMTEQTGRHAQTMHSLLEYAPDGSGRFVPRRNEHDPLDADVIVVDEMSMVDVRLMANLLRAVDRGTRLILIGDTYQLPSVGPGNVLKDLIASGQIPSFELTEIKRQEQGAASLIIENCHAIKDSKMIDFGRGRPDRDFYFVTERDPKKIQEIVIDLVQKRLPGEYGVDPLKDIQVITGTNTSSDLSCLELGKLFQRRINERDFIKGSERFKIGDKVIQTKNDHKKGILNGDIGYVQNIWVRERKIIVQFESPVREVELGLYSSDLRLAYAVTVHKYQGSEAPIIIMPIHRCLAALVTQRNWLYTGVSRAKKVCVLVGDPEEIPRIISRNQQRRRYTGLLDYLKEIRDGNG